MTGQTEGRFDPRQARREALVPLDYAVEDAETILTLALVRASETRVRPLPDGCLAQMHVQSTSLLLITSAPVIYESL